MKEFMKEKEMDFIFTALACIVGGIVLIIWPGVTVMVVCRLIGIVILVMGILQLIEFFSAAKDSAFRSVNLGLAIILAVVGIWIIARPDFVISLIPIIMGILMLLHGVSDIQKSVVLKQGDYKFWWVALILGIATAALGVVLFANPFATINVVVKVIGAFLIYDGISDIWIYSKTRKIVKAVKDAVKESTMDIID